MLARSVNSRHSPGNPFASEPACPKMSMRVVVVPFPGEDTEIDVDASDTVEMVKDRVRAMGRLSSDSYISVHVKLSKSRGLDVDIEDSDTMDAVKGKIPDRDGINKNQYTFVFDAYLGRCQFQITVNRISGASFKLEVAWGTSVGETKAEIQRKKGIPQDQQQLVFDEVLLEDNRTLRSYNIENGSTLSLIVPSPPTDADS